MLSTNLLCELIERQRAAWLVWNERKILDEAV